MYKMELIWNANNPWSTNVVLSLFSSNIVKINSRILCWLNLPLRLPLHRLRTPGGLNKREGPLIFNPKHVKSAIGWCGPWKEGKTASSTTPLPGTHSASTFQSPYCPQAPCPDWYRCPFCPDPQQHLSFQSQRSPQKSDCFPLQSLELKKKGGGRSFIFSCDSGATMYHPSSSTFSSE